MSFPTIVPDLFFNRTLELTAMGRAWRQRGTGERMSCKILFRIFSLVGLMSLGAASGNAQTTKHVSEANTNAPGTTQNDSVADTHRARLPIHLPERGKLPTADPEGVRRIEEMTAQVEAFWKPAQEFYRAGKLAQAEKACLQAIAIREKFDNLSDNMGREFLGQIYLKGGQNQKALTCFQQVLPHGPSERLHLDIALTYCRMGRFTQAQQIYNAPIVQRYIADFLLKYGFGDKTANLDNLPGTDDAEALYASILLVQGFDKMLNSFGYEEALQKFQQADKLRPKNPLVHLYWALTLRNLERDGEAIAHFQIAAQRGNGVVVKTAQDNLARSQQSVESLKQRQEQQAKKQLAKIPAAPSK